MARSRNIKPGLYKNEDLAECSIWARYLFPGLWMLADREGRLEDRPRRIKGELLPFDSQDVEPLLVELALRGFLTRYRNEDGAFIQIVRFLTHQTPHYSEKKSVIKPPDLQASGFHDEVAIPRNDGAVQTSRHAAKDLYFIQRGGAGGPIKIGISDRVELRARHLSSSGPEPMTLLVYVEQDDEINEKTLHARFAQHRLGGEWFRPCEELTELIGNLASRSNSGSAPPIKRGSQPPDSLIPDSLIPDSLKTPLSGSPPDGAPKKPNGNVNYGLQAREILSFLNEKARKNFHASGTNIGFILHRLKEGATVLECRQVIAMKCREWLGTDQAKFLRPETLFNRTKFGSYQGELVRSDVSRETLFPNP